VDQRQRTVLITLASVAGVLAVLLIVLALTGGGTGSSAKPGQVASANSTVPEATTTSTTAPTTTTVALLPVTSDPTTVAGAKATTTTTTTAAPGPIVPSSGAVLAPPSSTITRPMGPGCTTLAEPGWTADCGSAHAKGGDLIWLIESGPGGAGLRASVWTHATGATWRQALAVADDDGGRFGHINARVADISGDGFDEIAFGFGVVGTQHLLQVDVVDGSKKVVAHRDFVEGAARVATGQLDGWSGRESSAGPQWVHEVIRFQSGSWRVVSSTVVKKSAVPPSQL
jgi:hypothetical protein